MKFTQTIRERRIDPETGASEEIGPSITFTVEAEPGFTFDPDSVSRELGLLVAKWLGPNRSVSVKSTIDPWPLPDDWTTRQSSEER